MDINKRLEQIELSLAEFKNRMEASIKEIKIELARKSIAPVVETPKPVVETPKPVVETPKPVVETPKPVVETPQVKPPTELINLLNSKEWPHAVDPALICDVSSEQDKEDRAEGILDLIIDVHLENLRFLDFGCGEGHVINKSRTQKPKMAVGYDIKKSEKWDGWEKSPNVFFTNDWNEIKNLGPFNIVLLYDAIDHMLGSQEEVIAQLTEIKKLLAPNAKIYVRTHPWCSRHGTHLYHQINKAFIHIVFTDEEIAAMGYKQEPIRKIITPVWTYAQLFSAAGLKIQSGPHHIKEGVEPFFVKTPAIAQRIKEHYKYNTQWKNGTFPTQPLENQFIDYILM